MLAVSLTTLSVIVIDSTLRGAALSNYQQRLIREEAGRAAHSFKESRRLQVKREIYSNALAELRSER